MDMSTKPAGFKHNFLGGFRQTDVTQYIKRLADQRNEYKKQLEALEEEKEALAEERETILAQNGSLSERVAELEAKLTALEQKNSESALEAMAQSAREALYQAMDDLRPVQEKLSAAAEELENAVALGQSTLAEARGRLSALTEELDAIFTQEEEAQEDGPESL